MPFEQQMGIAALGIGIFCLALYGFIERDWIANRVSQWWRRYQ